MSYRNPKTGEVFEKMNPLKCYCIKGCKYCALDFRKNGTHETCSELILRDPAEAARLMGYEVIDDEGRKAHWVDNADSYICSACGHEVDNPNRQPCGAGECSKCGAEVDGVMCESPTDTPTVSGGTPTKEDNMAKPDKPRLAEVLGVKVGQKWRVVCPEEGIDSVEVWLNEKGHLIGETLIAGSVILCAAINHPESIIPESIIRLPRLTEAELERCRVYGAKYLARDKTSREVIMYEEKPDEVAEGSYGGGGYIGSVICRLFPSVYPGSLISVEEATP